MPFDPVFSVGGPFPKAEKVCAEVFSRSPEPTHGCLYHYTGYAAAKAIVENGELFATDIRYLNDVSEARLIRERFQADATSNPERALFAQADMFGGMGLYAACFSSDADSLDMWRSYPGDVGGCALGFSYASVAQAAREQGYSLFPCVYDPADQAKIIEAVDQDLAEYRKENYDPNAWRPEELAHDIGASMLHNASIFKQVLGPAFKHEGFASEKEWRLVKWDVESKMLHRAGRFSMIPYLTLRIGPPVRATIAPLAPDQSVLAVEAMNRWLPQTPDFVGACASSIPYRPT